MANEFVARNGIVALDNSTISGSLSVTNSVSGSIFTGSFIGNLIGTSSQALTASFIQASGVAGLNLSQIATGSITASVSLDSGSFSVTSGSSNFLFVSSSGQIGIGDTSPSDTLVINGRTRINGANKLAFGNSSGGYAQIGVSAATTGTLIFTNYNGSTTIESMRLTNVGDVGIGVPSPSARLHVSGTSGTLLQTTNGSTTGLFVSSSGFVGIGTNLPSASLDITAGGMVVRGGGSTPPTQVNGLHFSFASNVGYIQSVQVGSVGRQLEISGYPLIFKSSQTGVETMRISTANNVSINRQVNGNANLDVSGSVLVSGSLAVSGSASITGSLGVTGNITAQTLIVQTVSSSIIYSSGSNIFGDASNDNQIFTGSVLISGSITVSGSVTNNLTASYALNADALDGINSTQLATTGSNIFRGTQSITGSLIVSSSTFATAIIGSGSGVFTVDGTSGRLFSVDDSLSGSLFSVNTAAGLPVMEAFSNNTVRIGQFGRRALFVSQSAVGIGKETGINGILDISGSSVNVTGSLNVFGTVTNNLTASFAISASHASNFNAGYAKTFSQVTPAVTWSFIHDLNSLVPLIQVYDLNYSQILPATIVNTSRSGSLITFATSQSGYAVISTGGITVTGSNAILSQTTPATTWSFAHNLNTQFPVFTVFDSSNNVIVPLQINATNANTASIYFSSPQIGTAVAANGGVGAAASNNATASFTNSSTWTFNHNLNRQNVIVQTYDASYNQIIPQNIQLTSINTAVITFPSNTSGFAIASIGGVTGQAVSASYAFTSSFVLPLSQSIIVSGSGNTTVFQVLTGSATPAFMVSASGNVGIGTSNPVEKLDVFGDIRLRTDATGLGPSLILNNGTEAANNYSQIAFGGTANATTYLKGGIAYVTLASTNGRGDMYFLQNSATDGTNATLANAVMVISNSGSVGIGSTSLTGISLRISKNITGDVATYGVHQDGTVQSDVTTVAYGYINRSQTQATAFTLPNYRHFAAAQGTLGANSAVTLQVGYYAESNLTGGATNYGFQGLLPSSGSRNWNLYMNGTAPNYFAGNVGIGKISSNSILDVSGSALITGSLSITGSAGVNTLLQVGTPSTPGLFVSASGNVGIGTSNPLSLLDVNVLSSGARRLLVNYADSLVTIKSANDTATAENLRVWGDNIFFYTGSAGSGGELMRLTNTGRVGIGTTSPSQKFEVVGGEIKAGRVDSSQEGGQVSFGRASDNNTTWYIDAYGSSTSPQLRFVDVDNSAVRMVLTGSNVGIGTSSPAYPLDVQFGGSLSQRIRNSAAGGTATLLLETANTFSAACQTYIQCIGSVGNGTSQLAFGTAGASGDSTATERMRITGGGNVLIGTTSNVGQKLRIYQPTTSEWNIKLVQPNGSNQLFQEFLTTTDGDASNTARGSITYNGTNVLYTGTSDYRLKEDLKEYNGLSIISQLKTYDFKWKEAGTRDYGMMAHELQEILPNVVTGEKDALNEDNSIKPQGVDYSKLVPVLVKAIQEQQATITSLQARIEQLENK